MPYITAEQKMYAEFTPLDAGELNYAITKLIKTYFDRKPKYQTINDILGALEGAKHEFYRRVVFDYEDGKIKINGDVY
jgi:hypothetical protein